MNYLYMQCRNWDMSKKQKEISNKYGIYINADTLEQADILKKYLKRVLDVCTENNLEIDDCLQSIEIQCREKGLENWQLKPGDNTLRNTIERLLGIIYQYKSYESDIVADTYMAWLWSNDEYDIKYVREIEDLWEAKCTNGNSINREAVRENYPYASLCGFPEYAIHGGCKEYHKLMMRSEHKGIFDYEGKTKSLKRYGYMDTRKRYLALKDTSVENLLLLERTQGIEYTNIIFGFLHAVVKDEELARYIGIYKEAIKFSDTSEFTIKDEDEYLVQKGLMIEPVFLRKQLIVEIWNYIERGKYSKNSIEIAGMILDIITEEVNMIYNALFEVAWTTYYLAYMSTEKRMACFPKREVESYLREICNEYFKDNNKVYGMLSKIHNIYNWAEIENVEQCFTHPNDLDVCSLDTIFNMEVVMISFSDSNVEGECLKVRKVVKGIADECLEFERLGREIREHAIKQCQNYAKSEIIKSKDSEDKKEKINLGKQLREFLYNLEANIFCEIRDKQEKKLADDDPKTDTVTLKPMHVYAILQKSVIKCLCNS